MVRVLSGIPTRAATVLKGTGTEIKMEIFYPFLESIVLASAYYVFVKRPIVSAVMCFVVTFTIVVIARIVRIF